jgi:hypothetical protein
VGYPKHSKENCSYQDGKYGLLAGFVQEPDGYELLARCVDMSNNTHHPHPGSSDFQHWEHLSLLYGNFSGELFDRLKDLNKCLENI